MMYVAAVGARVVIAAKHEARMHAAVGGRDYVAACGRVEREPEWAWRCRRCRERGVGKVYRCPCGMPVCPAPATGN